MTQFAVSGTGASRQREPIVAGLQNEPNHRGAERSQLPPEVAAAQNEANFPP
jgi:hypothetical protein